MNEVLIEGEGGLGRETYLGCDGEGAEVDGSGFEDVGYGGWDGHRCGWLGSGSGHVCMYV